MNFLPSDLAKFFDILGKNLVRDAIHPVCGITIAQWLLDTESAVTDCLATGLVALLMILAAALVSLGISRIIVLLDRNQ